MDSTRNVLMSLAKDNKKVKGAKSKANSSAKYNFRTKSIQNRIEVEQRKSEPRHPKPKQKPAPLSKYRRRTANLRERCRMQEMNDAFKRLQSVVPDVLPVEEHSDSSTGMSQAKLSKINTLKLAVNYISALTQMLTQPDNATKNHLSVKVNKENKMFLAAVEGEKEFGRNKSTGASNYQKCDLNISTQPTINQFYNKSMANFYSNNSCNTADMNDNNFVADSSKIQFCKVTPKCLMNYSSAATELVSMSSYDFVPDSISAQVNPGDDSRIYTHLDYASTSPPPPPLGPTNSLSQVMDSCTHMVPHPCANDNIANILDDFDTFIGTFDNDDSNLAFVTELID